VVLEAGFGDRDRFRDRQNAQFRSPILKMSKFVKIVLLKDTCHGFPEQFLHLF